MGGKGRARRSGPRETHASAAHPTPAECQQWPRCIAPARLRRLLQRLLDDGHQFAHQLLRDLGVVEDLCGQVSEESIAPITAPTNSFCRSGLAENWANELFWACCCRVSLSSSRFLLWVTTLRTLESA